MLKLKLIIKKFLIKTHFLKARVSSEASPNNGQI